MEKSGGNSRHWEIADPFPLSSDQSVNFFERILGLF